MFNHPEQFIQEKLSKKALSANTVRDLILAAFLVALQKNELILAKTALSDDWMESKAIEIREKANQIFDRIDAPFEYPTLLQLEKGGEALKKIYCIEKLPPRIQSEFDQSYELIPSKFCKPL